VAADLGLAGRGRPTAVLTVEAGADALVGTGQTHAAGALLGVPATALDLPGADHDGLFTGPRFEREVAPTLQRFLAAAGP
jgi:poly-beta-hydroxyalkanoate depolymerase